jgi:hypothetical protein
MASPLWSRLGSSCRDIGEQEPISGSEAIERIAALPAELRKIASAMTEKQIDTAYREGGWTARQVIHHLADSHANSHVRFRLALTEERPTIKPYDEKKWAELSDGREGPIEPSLRIVEGLHERWAALLRSLAPADFDRVVIHPVNGEMTLARLLRIYAWHGRHHLAHLEMVKSR